MDFEEIYIQYSPQVFRVCMGYCNNYEEARDLTQETFIAIWKGLPSFKQRSSLGTWIFRIATNICLRAIEKSARLPTAELPDNLNIAYEAKQEDRLQHLYNCIAALEETDRIIISLVLEDLPQADIADIVGLSHANIRVKVHRIKEKLAEKFKHNG